MTSPARVNHRVAAEFVHALQNGILSRRECRDLVAVALEELRSAEDPDAELEAVSAVIRAARALSLARTTREYLARFEGRAGEVIEELKSDTSRTMAAVTPALRERVRSSLAHALGRIGLFTIVGSGSAGDDGSMLVELLINGTHVRVKLGPIGGAGETATETILDAELLEAPEVLDVEIVRRLEEAMRGHIGDGNGACRVLAYAGRPVMDGTQWTVTLQTEEGIHVKTLTLLETGHAILAPFTYDAYDAREMSAQLGLAAGLTLSAEAGPMAQLEVLVRASMRTPDELMPMAPEDSTVKFDEFSEVQWRVPSVWGDNAVFVTFNTQSGAVRVEDSN